MAPSSKKSKVTRNIPLENMLINLGVSETELHTMTREEQSTKYEVLIKEVAEVERFCCLCGGKDLWCQSTGSWYCGRCLE
jgi:ribosomal protein S27AE